MAGSWVVAEELEGTCNGMHEKHNHLIARRAKDAAIYPPELCRAICRGAFRQQMADEAGVKTSRPLTRSCLMSILAKYVKEGWKDEVHEDGGLDLSGPNQQDGISMMREYMQEMHTAVSEGRAWDDVSGMELELKRVNQARQEEMQFFEKRKAYTRCRRERVDIEEGKLIDTRWIDVNKGDEENPNYRSRLVGREFNTYDTEYAATPPLDSKRLLFPQFASEQRRGNEPLQLSVVDVKKAYV